MQTSVPRANVRARVWVKPTHLVDASYVEVAGVEVVVAEVVLEEVEELGVTEI